MKNVFFLLAAGLLAAGCTKLPHINFKGKVPGLTNAVFLVTDVAGTDIIGDNITNGTFNRDTVLENIGYGTISIKRNGRKDDAAFEVYLEPGEYSIEADTAHMDKYPAITSSSQRQKELTAYYTMQDAVRFDAEQAVEQLKNRVKNFKAFYIGANAEYTKLLNTLHRAMANVQEVKLRAFQKFLSKYPNSIIAPHVMEDIEYTSNPEAYHDIYEKLSPEAKNTDEGKRMGAKLTQLMKVLPGKHAPGINGTTPDGKGFDSTQLDKQVYVVDFWKAGNAVSRMNHQDMIEGIMKRVDAKKVGFISISLDEKRDWWTKAIADDHLTWTQYSDLKGNDSPNAANWVITTVPSIYLVSGKWRIIKRDAQLGSLEEDINNYLKQGIKTQ